MLRTARRVLVRTYPDATSRDTNLTGGKFHRVQSPQREPLQRQHFGGELLGADLESADLNQAVVTEYCPNQSPCPGIPFQFSFNGTANFSFASGPNFTDANLTDAKLRGVNLAGSTGVFLGTGCITEVFTTVCYQIIGSFTDAILTGVTSGGISGKPASLPAGWALKNGYLTMETGPLQITTSSLRPGTEGAVLGQPHRGRRKRAVQVVSDREPPPWPTTGQVAGHDLRKAEGFGNGCLLG